MSSFEWGDLLSWWVFLGYLISILVGHFFTKKWSDYLHSKATILMKREPVDRVSIFPIFIGISERFVICSLIGFGAPSQTTMGFIAFWVSLKTAGGWGSWNKGDPYGRAVFFAGLLGSTASVFFAVLGGLIILTR